MLFSLSSRKTKIIATLGPASESADVISQLIKEGVNIFRFNTKHADTQWHSEKINLVEKIADSLNIPIGILIDLQGPEIRTNTFLKKSVEVKRGDRVIFTSKNPSHEFEFKIREQPILDNIKVGNQILIDNGFFRFKVVEKRKGAVVAEAKQNSLILDRKGINIPGVKIDLPSLVDEDLRKLDAAATQKVDFVALSFTRSKKDILDLREELKKRAIEAFIVAKIENKEALENIDDIINETDALMIARGDLGVEVPIEEIAYWQKTLITKCREKSKPVIVATQMLESMVDHPTPTRAEASDIANAIFDGAGALMLSGESAIGKYPVEAVRTMARIAEFNENKVNPPLLVKKEGVTQTEAIARGAIDIMEMSVESKAGWEIDTIIVITESGNTARHLSKFRPKTSIIALTESKKVRDQLLISYGIRPFVVNLPKGEVVSLKAIIKQTKQISSVAESSRILFIHGNRWKIPGLTNTITVKELV